MPVDESTESDRVVYGCKQSDYPYVDVRLFDFRNFVCAAFEFQRLPSPTKRQMEIASWMQWGPMRLQAQAFRGEGKSILAELFCAWALLILYCAPHLARPEYAILSLSAAGARAAAFSTFVYNLIMNWELLAPLRPQVDGRSSKIGFDVGPAPVQDSPSMRALGVTGQMAGSRSNLCVMDDVEVPNNSATQLRRETLAEAVKEVDALYKPIPTDAEIERTYPHLPIWLAKQLIGRIIVLGTPQTEETIYELLVRKGYRRRIWPARYPDQAWMDNNGADLSPVIAEELAADPSLATGWGEDGKQGKPTDTRFGDMDLCERAASYGRSGFALQFMLDTTLSDADRYPLKIRDLVVMDLDPDQAPQKISWASSPDLVIEDLECVGFKTDRYHRPWRCSDEWAEYTGCVMAIDPAGRGKDETSYSIVKILNSTQFLVENHGFGPSSGYEDDVLTSIALAAKKHGVKAIIVEKNFGDGMFVSLLKPFLRDIYPCSIEEVSHSVQKERRIIETLEPVMNQHKLVVSTGVVKGDVSTGRGLSEDAQLQYQLFYQLSRLTNEKGSLLHDDKLDSLAMAVKYWVDQMSQSADDQIKIRRNKSLDKELRKFMRAATGRGQKTHTWASARGRGR